MPGKRTLRIQLEDGLPGGLRVAGIARWEGVAVLAYRRDMKAMLEREELGRSGVLVLRDPTGRDRRVLVEETSAAPRQLKVKHYSDPMWSEAIMLTTDGKSELAVEEARFLAACLTKKALRVGLASPKLDAIGRMPSLSEQQRARMARYIGELQVLLPFLRVDEFTDTLLPVVASDGSRQEVFELAVQRRKPDTAWAVDAEAGFTVLQGSNASVAWDVNHKTKRGWRRRRDQLELDGTLQRKDGQCRFTRNVLFQSAGEAAQVVCGAPRSGKDYWRNENDGRKYRDWKEPGDVA